MDRFIAPIPSERLPVSEILTEVSPLAVDLGERATALAAIMEYLNYAARTKGARLSGKTFTDRYGDRSSAVLRGMDAKRSELRQGFDEGLDTLIAGRALRARGVDEVEIETERRAMQVAINRRFGIGRTDARDRLKAVSAAGKAARSNS